MVTHNWSNLFHHLMAGIFADALDQEYYAGWPGIWQLKYVEICWNHTNHTGIYFNSKHETHIFCAGVAEMLLHAAGCEQLDNAVQDGMGHNFFPSSGSHTCRTRSYLSQMWVNLEDKSYRFLKMVLKQRSEMLWLTWLDRASSEAKNCGEKSYWAVASFEHWTEPL